MVRPPCAKNAPMTGSNITCPKCGAEIPLTEAISHRLRERFAADFEKQRAELNAALAEREQKYTTEKAALEERAQALNTEVARQLEAGRTKLLADATRQAGEKLGTEMKDLQAQVIDHHALWRRPRHRRPCIPAGDRESWTPLLDSSSPIR